MDTPGDRAVGQPEVPKSLAVLADCSQVTGVQAVQVIERETCEAR